MTRDELFAWAEANARKYSALNRLCEAAVDNETFIFLPGRYGAYRGLYLCFRESAAVDRLRREGCAVGVVDSYATARKLLLECAKYKKRQIRRAKNEKRNKRPD